MEPMWPRYPTVSTRNPVGGVLNGVRVVTEEWEGRGSSDAILDFYRGQMLSRGWEDQTERSLGLGPDLLASTTDPSLLQDPGFLSQYEDVVGRTMVLGRGDFSMIVQTGSIPGRPEMNRVRITGAATPDVVRFALGSFVPSGGPRKPQSAVPSLRYEGRIGSERHQATLSVTSEHPSRAFRNALNALQRDRWRTLSQTELSAGPEHRTWLVRGKQHALLSATPDGSGRGTALAFAELGPE